MRPAHRELVAGEFHPDAVHRILRNDEHFGHDKGVAVVNADLLACRIDGHIV